MGDEIKIRYVNHSVANRFNNLIEINKHLRNYPKLLEPILEHELSHTNKAFTSYDLKLDFLSKNKLNYFYLMKFMFRHPLSFLQLSPILYSRKKGFIIDYNLLIMYFVMVLVFGLTIYFGGKYL